MNEQTPQEQVAEWWRRWGFDYTAETDEPLRELLEILKPVLAELDEYHGEGMIPAGAWAHDLGRLKRVEAERDELRAEVERLQSVYDRSHSAQTYTAVIARAEKAEAEVKRLRWDEQPELLDDMARALLKGQS